MPDPTRIICLTLVPVGPRLADRSLQKFALITVAGVDNTDSPDGLEPELFKPWNWDFGAIRAYAYWPGGSAEGTALLDGEHETARLPDRIADLPDTTVSMLEMVRALFARPVLYLYTNPDVEGAEPTAPTLAEQLTYLAGTLGVIPQKLKLLRYLSFSFPAPVPANATYYAVPEIDGRKPVARPPQPEPEQRWTYDGAGITTQARSFGSPPLASTTEGQLGPDLGTYWIRVGKTEARPWSDDVVRLCRDATHLYARLADCLHRYPASEALARHLAIVGLSCYGSAEPQQRLNALAKVSKAQPPALQLPVNWETTVQGGLALRSTTSSVLLEFDKSVAEEPLIWLWQEAEELVKSALRDGSSGNNHGAAAAHRALADRMVQEIIGIPADAPRVERRTAITRERMSGLLFTALEGVPVADNIKPELDTYLATHWTAYCKAFADELWPVDAAVPMPPAREERVSGFGIELDEVRLGKVADEELWNELAGIGVLIRRKPAGAEWGPWRVLDVARTELEVSGMPHATTQAWPELFAGSAAERLALIPVRLPVRDGLRHPFLVYENKSLVATSPLDDAMSELLDDQRASGMQPGVEARLRYRESLVTRNPQDSVKAALLPPLKFGDDYQLAAFGIDLAGGMPTEITEPGIPWRHRTLEPAPTAPGDPVRGAFGLEPDEVPDVARTSALTYKRRVPIGALRVDRMSLTNEPDVPDGLRPLARELENDIHYQQQDAAAAGEPRPHKEHRADPLIVRRHDLTDSLLALRVGLPTVDIDLLERSVGVQAAKPARAHWLAHVHVPKSAEDKLNASIETAFVDPAIRTITLRIEERDFARPRAPWRMIASDVVAAVDLTIPDNHLERRLRLSARFATAGEVPGVKPLPADPVTGEPARVLVLPAGDEAAVFRISVVVDDVTADIFDAGVLAGAPSSYRLVIERASPLVPSAGELYKWFQIDAMAEKPRRRVRTWLEPSAGDESRFRVVVRNLATAEVLRHSWRWLGRPRPRWLQGGLEDNGQPWPRDPEVVDRTSSDVRKWEETAFVDLDPTGLSIPPETRRLSVGSVPLPESHEQAPSAPLLVDDRSTTLQAQYIRYCVRVASRYASLYKLEAIEAAEERASVHDKYKKVRHVGWRAIYLPPDLASEPVPPVILAALPLTREYSDDIPAEIDAPTGVLVVLDEVAFQSCGISEGLIAEIKVTDDHWGATPAEKELLPEYGRSSINTNEQWEKTPWRPGSRLALDGPYGFTLEPASVEPRFTSSAYVLMPPFMDKKLEATSRSRAWDMMSVRFQRVTNDHPSNAPSEAPTAWTKPIWLQLGANGKALTPIAPRLANGQLGGLPQPPPDDPVDARAFYAAITRSIVNVQGGTRDELYVATALVEAGVARVNVPNLGDNVTLYVRILEVQRAMPSPRVEAAVTFPSGEHLWQNLFPDTEVSQPDLVEPRYRIVRVSPRRTIIR